MLTKKNVVLGITLLIIGVILCRTYDLNQRNTKVFRNEGIEVWDYVNHMDYGISFGDVYNTKPSEFYSKGISGNDITYDLLTKLDNVKYLKTARFGWFDAYKFKHYIQIRHNTGLEGRFEVRVMFYGDDYLLHIFLPGDQQMSNVYVIPKDSEFIEVLDNIYKDLGFNY